MSKFIGYAKQTVDKSDIQSVVDVLSSDFLSQGPKIEEFEANLADYTGSKYCVVVSSGTAALHLAVKALGLDAGASGITSPITFVATANAFVHNRVKPEFVDIDAKTYCLSPQALEKKVCQPGDVVIPVHFSGQPAEMKYVFSIAQKKGLHVIEDASHALGSRFPDGAPVGSNRYARLTTFSFQPLKTITTGEGGAITTNDPELYDKLQRYRNHGIVKEIKKFKASDLERAGAWYHEIQDLGFNFRLTDFQAALGISQLKKIDFFIQRRREIVNSYNSAFSDLDWLTCPYEDPDVLSAFHLYVILVDFESVGKSRDLVMNELREKGIGTQVHYIPLHLQPFFSIGYGFQKGDFPYAEKYYEQCLSIPLHVGMSEDDVVRVITAVREIPH